jgi:hypothetical protein
MHESKLENMNEKLESYTPSKHGKWTPTDIGPLKNTFSMLWDHPNLAKILNLYS